MHGSVGRGSAVAKLSGERSRVSSNDAAGAVAAPNRPILSALKRERDMFAAFALAANDLLVEADKDGNIFYDAGGVESMMGADLGEFGTTLFDLVARQDQQVLLEILYRLTCYRRIDRVMVRLNHFKQPHIYARVSGVAMPELKGMIHLGFQRIPAPLPPELLRQGITEMPEYLSSDAFLNLTETRMAEAAQLGRQLKLTMIDVDIAGVDDAAAQRVREGIGSGLKAWSLDGNSVAQLEDGKFMVLHNAHEKPPEGFGERTRDIGRKVEPKARLDVAEQGVLLDADEVGLAARGGLLKGIAASFEKLGRGMFGRTDSLSRAQADRDAKRQKVQPSGKHFSHDTQMWIERPPKT